MSRATAFTHAIMRRPAESVVAGLRAEDRGDPDLSAFAADHVAYQAALRAAGVAVTLLEPLEAFPDSVFVEDAALCLPEGAILMRLGAPSRVGEPAHVEAPLAAFYGEVARIVAGHVEGGDVLVTDREILVGRSARTDGDGVAALRAIVADWGWPVREVTAPPEVLHFKTDCGLLDGETVLATPRLAASGCFAGYRLLETAQGEAAAANCVAVNDRVLFPAGFPRTAELVGKAGFRVHEIGNAEAAKVDGGMSCLSLRFDPPS